jgi:hypothetical protein
MIQVVINYISAAIRWVFETIWRSLTKKEKFTFEHYLNGHNESEDLPAATRRRFANFLAAAITILIVVILAMKFQES